MIKVHVRSGFDGVKSAQYSDIPSKHTTICKCGITNVGTVYHSAHRI